MAPDIIERLKGSAYHQLYLALLLFTHARYVCAQKYEVHFD